MLELKKPDEANVDNGVINPVTIFDQARLSSFGDKLRQLQTELTEIFPEREHLINQIIYALLTKEHVLVHGIFGTGKTDLVNAVFNAFEGQRVFSIALTKFMSESHVIGIPDPKEMREEGIVHYQREGGILDAHFAELDEIFDANAPLLRVLLGILNERHFKRGRQFEKAELHMALASTNGDPETILKQAPELGAVIDRFIFTSRVQYLAGDESRRKMYKKYVADRRPTVKIAYSDLAEIANIVVGTSLAIDDQFIAAYDEAIQAYRKAIEKTRQVISDRRACKLLKLVRASAVLHGRLEVDLEDILAIRWGICTGNDKAQHAAFDTAVVPVVDKAKKARQQSVDTLCLKLVNEYTAAVPSLPKELKDDEALKLFKKVNAQIKLVEDLHPQLPSTEDKRKKLLATLNDLSAKLQAQLAK